MEKQSDEPVTKRQNDTFIAAFDKLQLCYTVFPQLKHYYRYGELRDCSKERKIFMEYISSSRGKNEKVGTSGIYLSDMMLLFRT